MIRANEARELVKQSELVVGRNLTLIDVKIRAKAAEGKMYLNLDEILGEDIFKPGMDKWHKPNFTPMQLVYYKKLVEFGFRVDFVEETHTIGGGFKSMDDESKEENWWHLRVMW